LPNSPQAGSDMLNNMIASFSASNQVGELMKKRGEKELQEEKNIELPEKPEAPETRKKNNLLDS
jgi:hypothetical protein